MSVVKNKKIVCSMLLACAPGVVQAQLATSCSEAVRKTCWTAGSLYFKDTTFYTVIGCQKEMYILDTVVGSDCAAKSDGYKMYSAKQSNWVRMEIKNAKWVGDTKTGFCWRTTSIQDGYSVECSECKTYFGPDGQSQRCTSL